MFKFGLYKKEQLSPRYMEGFFNKRKFIALDLYNCLDGLPKEIRDSIQERMLIRFSVVNGTFKYTYADRFDDFEDRAVEIITKEMPKGKHFRVHDIGVSDGRTTHGFYKKLDEIYGRNLDYIASDYAPYMFVLTKEGESKRVILDSDHNPLQIVFPPFVFNLAQPESKVAYPINHIVRKMVELFYMKPVLHKFENGMNTDIEKNKFEIICKECRDYKDSKSNFSFRKFDLFANTEEEYDAVRVMNVLNETYFSTEELSLALDNIISFLKDGGLFITGSNKAKGSVVNGCVYKKEKDKLSRLFSSGDGAPIDFLIS